MKNFARLVAFCSILLAFTSCGKEKSIDTLGVTPGGSGSGSGSGNGGGSSNGSEVASWKFVSMHVVTSETMDATYMGMPMKVINTSDYTTNDNAGYFKFDGSVMFTTDWAFSVNTQRKMVVSSGGQTFPAQSMPFTATLPATTETSNYKKIGTDSLYFSAGVTIGVNSGGFEDKRPAGCKLKWDGDKLYMTWSYTETSTGDYNGVTGTVTGKYTYVTTLQKQ
jgi:flagellar basal body rod protein FlgG